MVNAQCEICGEVYEGITCTCGTIYCPVTGCGKIRGGDPELIADHELCRDHGTARVDPLVSVEAEYLPSEEEAPAKEEVEKFKVLLLDDDWHFHYLQKMDDTPDIKMVPSVCVVLCSYKNGGLDTPHLVGYAHKNGNDTKYLTPAAVCVGCGAGKFLGPVKPQGEDA